MTLQNTESNTLTVARNWIGRLHQLDTSTRTQESFSVLSASPNGTWSYGQIALSILKNTLFEASYMFTHTNGCKSVTAMTSLQVSKQAYAFLSGTGLDIMLDEYQLDYSAESIRNAFYEKFQIRPS